MATSRSDSPDDGVLDQEEIDLLKRVSKSQVWRLIRDALGVERERLFAGNSTVSGLDGQPTTNEALWMNRGAILLAQWLLQEAPLFVIWSRRYMEEQQEKRTLAKIVKKAAEREYVQNPEFSDKPEFDL